MASDTTVREMRRKHELEIERLERDGRLWRAAYEALRADNDKMRAALSRIADGQFGDAFGESAIDIAECVFADMTEAA